MVEREKIDSIVEFERRTSKTYSSGLTNYEFENIEFLIPIKLLDSNIVIFKNCLFKEKMETSYSINQNSTFEYSTFEKEAIFTNSKFMKNVRFYGTQFHGKTNFDNTTFNNLADFWNATFKKTTIFYKTDFLGTTVFSSTIFEENVLFTYSLINKLFILRGTIFNKGLDLSLAIIPGEMSIFDVKFDITKFKDVNDTEDVNLFDKNVACDGVITRKNKRETFRILKSRLISNQNSIDALEFSRYEMNAYAKQLEQNVFREKKTKSIQSLILLYLNIISSKHGTSWFRGVCFTLIIGLFFFYISIIATENYSFSLTKFNWSDFTTCVKYFFTFMLPTHGIDYLENEKPKLLFYLWDFLGRIFVSYGIYQTIQAFRKFKNK